MASAAEDLRFLVAASKMVVPVPGTREFITAQQHQHTAGQELLGGILNERKVSFPSTFRSISSKVLSKKTSRRAKITA